MRFLHASAQHIGARRSQEDSFLFSSIEDKGFLSHAGFLAVLCDGMGGMAHGGEASRAAAAAFLAAYQTKKAQESIPDALQRSVRETNTIVVELSRQLRAPEGIGTTLIGAVLHKSFLHFVSVGDSGLFHLDRGTLRLINHPHVFGTFLDQAVARGDMTEQAAQEHPERDALTSFIGAEPLEEVDFNRDPIRVSAGDTILLASDGLFNTLSAKEIRKALE